MAFYLGGQSVERDHRHTVIAGMSNSAYAYDDRFYSGGLLAAFGKLLLKAHKILGCFVFLGAAELDLESPPGAIGRLNYQVDFKVACVVVTGQPPLQTMSAMSSRLSFEAPWGSLPEKGLPEKWLWKICPARRGSGYPCGRARTVLRRYGSAGRSCAGWPSR